MSDILVSRISKNGLSKGVFEFTYEGEYLEYTGYMLYHRSSRKEKWADEWAKPLSFEAWCKKYNRDEEPQSSDDYYEYREKLNPIAQRTRQGKAKAYGIYGEIKAMPPCPPDVAKEAKQKFIKSLKVRYK